MFRWITRRRFAIVLCLAAGAGPGLAWAQEQPVRGGTLTIALHTDPATLNSAIDTSPQVQIVATKIFGGLVTYDLDMKLKPELAESWQVSADGKRITFKLRRGVKWHDGKDFTSDDVAFSVMKGFGQLHGMSRAVFANVTAVETPDAHTATLVLSAPAPAIMNALAAMLATILPKHIYDNTDMRTNPANLAPIGTGPFKFVEWKRGTSIVLARNPDYWEKDKPYLDQVVFRIIPDTQARGAAVESGQVHMIFHSLGAASDARRLGALPTLALTTDGYHFASVIAFIEFNLEHPILKDVRVRRAIAHAIDRKFILDNVWLGFGKVATGPIHPNLKQAYSDDVPKYAHDPKLAEKMLDEAGYPRKEGGIRFKMTNEAVPFGDQYQRMAQYIKQALAEVGIQVDVRNQDFGSWVRRIWTTREWETNISAITNSSDPSIGVQRAFWSKNIRQGVPFTNSSWYRNPAADALFESTATEIEPAKRLAQFAELQKILAADLPILPLVAVDQFTVVSRRVRNHSITADGVYTSYANVWLAAR